MDNEIVAVLWDAMDVRELVQSIAASGFFDHEPLIVATERGKNVVIEGNRRLAAVRVLLDPKLIESSNYEIPVLSREDKKKLEELPVVRDTRAKAWRYLGFKHVNGPAKWSSYAKAKYIAEVHQKYKVSLEQIADQIGDRHQTVQRLYRGLMVIDQAERLKVYELEDRFSKRFAFSHLYSGLDGDGISTFLELKDSDEESKTPVPLKRKKELGELCAWLYGSKKNNRPPVVKRQAPDLWLLNDVLKSREATAALRDDNDLETAYQLSRPQNAVFEEALLRAKRELIKARATLTTGYDNSEDLLRIAGDVANLADDIYSEMERKQNPSKRRTTRN
ncbi:MAG TPA: ParB/Srx family N-terminal domain-containing protein [Pirellulaceae bacterium]|nr:ParB/Srx family N-terminal domain-containing protein [Pirellulaceae bacterium]HMO94424.1 ParB/Srx family N-terminal domain-containing protein [Pirellulaceae bacterium]